MLRKDSLKLGLLLGFLAPLLGLLAYYFAKFSLFTFKKFVGVVLAQKTLLTAMVSVSPHCCGSFFRKDCSLRFNPCNFFCYRQLSFIASSLRRNTFIRKSFCTLPGEN
jgi:hypothetical protein